VDELFSLQGNFCRAGQLHSFNVKLDEKIPRALPVELHKKSNYASALEIASRMFFPLNQPLR